MNGDQLEDVNSFKNSGASQLRPPTGLVNGEVSDRISGGQRHILCTVKYNFGPSKRDPNSEVT